MATAAEVAGGSGDPFGWRDVVALSGLVLTVGGFWIAIRQIRKSVSASRAAQGAVTITSERLTQNRLLILASQLQLAEVDLDDAVASDDRRAVEKALVRWRHLAASIRGTLNRIGGYQETTEQLAECLGHVIIAKDALRQGSKPLSTATARASALIAAVTDAVGSIAEEVSTTHEHLEPTD